MYSTGNIHSKPLKPNTNAIMHLKSRHPNAIAMLLKLRTLPPPHCATLTPIPLKYAHLSLWACGTLSIATSTG